MKALFLFSLLLSYVAWAADSVEVRIAVILTKEQGPELEKKLEALSSEHRRRHENRGRHGGGHGRKAGPEEKGDKLEEKGDKLEAEDLRPMQKALACRRHYDWFKRFSKKRATIDAKGETIELPGGAKATLRLKQLKDDVATLVVSLPNTETTYQLGRTGTLYLQAGKHEETEVWVVIAPARHFH
ncbi:MAG: hypothetical protein FWC28_06905 [Proteobacteria bacterium]|nr:hypothetical protein [Cystobacterineae bacterium]MCL2258585.1 hypothetical protein [Cystobacterineae bacterium]MCL2314959.1 hypothetical protein [Pseudomonadota bacterium]